MSNVLKVDGDLLESAASDLGTVSREFADADARADTIADEVGDAGLAEAVRAFSADWSNRREKMREGIDNLYELTRAVAETFTEADDELASVLENE
ncbi:hypothetical protein NKG05_05825 [Oerskovia sp. M15]